MDRSRDADRGTRQIGAGIAVMPGTVTSCFLVTSFTVLLAIYSDYEPLDTVLRPLYFAVLFGTFHAIRKRDRALHSLPLRLVELGFLVLTLGYTGAGIVRLAGIGDHYSLVQMERGAVFLLGVTLIAYGIVLFVPLMLENQRRLRERQESTQVKLTAVKSSHHRMERQIVEAGGYKALGELAAGVAHDLRNPLSIVKATAESLARRERSREDVDEHTRVISRNIEKAERTISALLDLGKPRKITLEPKELIHVVAEVLALVQMEAKRRRIIIDVECNEELIVLTDDKLLLQALLNLVLNAMHASPPESRIRIRLRRFCLAGHESAALAIEDEGPGLPEEVRRKLFTPFFTTKDGGTGLGLLSCKRILEDIGGRIGLYSRSQRGARALLVLPAHTARETQPIKEPVALP